MACSMKYHAALLLGRLGRHKPHVSPGDGFTDGLGIGGIVLVPLDVRLHVSRRHQPYRMAERLELPRPMVRRGAGLNTDQTRWQLLKKRQNVPTLYLATDDHLTFGVNAVNLEDRLGDIETDCCNRLHSSLL